MSPFPLRMTGLCLLRSGRDSPNRRETMKDRRATAIALAFAVLLIGSFALSRVLQPPTGKQTSGSPPENPPGCLVLRLLASSEKAGLMTAVASAYNTSGASQDGK